MVVHTCNLYSEAEAEGYETEASLGYITRPCLKEKKKEKKKEKRTENVLNAEHLPSI
jgi:hypothetical protein